MTISTLWDSIEGYLKAESVELDDLLWSGRVLKVLVDAEGGVGVDRIAEISRGLSRMLDDDPSLEDSYTLEVGSPGLERALRREAHYLKSLGREVKVKTSEPVDDEVSHRGILKAHDDTTTTIVVDGVDRSVPNDLITLARTVFTWDAGKKPGKAPAKTKKVS